MKPKYFYLCNLNKLREDFIIDFYKALGGKKKITKFYDQKELDLSVSCNALISKVYSMIYNGDMETVLRMLYSFRFGAKNIKSNPYAGRNHEDQYNYTDKDGNGKLSHKGNLPKAHFRWNYGERYLLSEDELLRIEKFLGAIFPPEIKYNNRKIKK